jgi:hypothetical protein
VRPAQVAQTIRRQAKGKQFFFEKKNQKTFDFFASPHANNQKFFASFFQKRRPFFPYAASPSRLRAV